MSSIALVGDVDGGVLRAAGWDVRGALTTMPYDDPRDVRDRTPHGRRNG